MRALSKQWDMFHDTLSIAGEPNNSDGYGKLSC